MQPYASTAAALGADINLEQQLYADLGLFARVGTASGNVEPYEFTDIDRTVAAGLSLKGSAWRRAQDTVGLALIDNGISAAREQYLNAGGSGHPHRRREVAASGPEEILETYYSAALLPCLALTFDYQWVNNPGYNRDRGPVSIVAVRVHAQF